MCKPCHPSCRKCEDATNLLCAICADHSFRFSTSVCMDKCPAQFFENTTAKFCQSCHYECIACKGPLSTDCYSCGPTEQLDLDDNKCYPPASAERKCIAPKLITENKYCSFECPLKYYIENNSSECLPCFRTCLTCNGSRDTQCTTCLPPLRLN